MWLVIVNCAVLILLVRIRSSNGLIQAPHLLSSWKRQPWSLKEQLTAGPPTMWFLRITRMVSLLHSSSYSVQAQDNHSNNNDFLVYWYYYSFVVIIVVDCEEWMVPAADSWLAGTSTSGRYYSSSILPIHLHDLSIYSTTSALFFLVLTTSYSY